MKHVWTILRFPIQTFLAGLFTVLPLVVTIAIVMWVGGILDGYLGPGTWLGRLLSAMGLRLAGNETFAYLLGWVLVLAVIFGVGLLVEFGARKLLRDRVDALLSRLPLLGGVYGTVRQLVGMMDKREQANLKGMQVVYCRFGGEGGTLLLALMPTPERFHIGNADYQVVVIPTAPVPIGGALIFVPVNSIIASDMSMDAFMSLYVSMGVTGPQILQAAETKSALSPESR
jgi:uncharacterized membrane protein